MIKKIINWLKEQFKKEPVNIGITYITVYMDDGEKVTLFAKGIKATCDGCTLLINSKSNAENLISTLKYFKLSSGKIYLRHRVKEITMKHEDYWV